MIVNDQEILANRDLKRVYITGATGTGKSTLGNAFLNNKTAFKVAQGTAGTLWIESSKTYVHRGDEKKERISVKHSK